MAIAWLVAFASFVASSFVDTEEAIPLLREVALLRDFFYMNRSLLCAVCDPKIRPHCRLYRLYYHL